MSMILSRISAGRAIVLGASMAGLLAARVLADRFDEVRILERDPLPDGAAPRKGTPQAGHAHGLLARGREILEELLPGFTDALAARGGLVGDMQANAPFVFAGHRTAAGHSGQTGLVASRHAIEAEVRRRVLALPNVRAMTEVEVLGPTIDAQGGRVEGVRFRQRDGDGSEKSLLADFVVDCTGRGSHASAWLQAWGYQAPAEERVSVGIAYATGYFRREPAPTPGIAAIICAATSAQPLPGVMLAQEPDDEDRPRWVVTLGGYSGDHPVPTLDGLRARALQMGCPEIIRVTHEAEPLGAVTRYNFPYSQRRRFERLRRMPERFLAMGDSVASFNPIYGQGMTVACCEALALGSAIDAGLDGAWRRYYPVAAHAVDVPWQLAVGADLAIASVPGPRPLPVRLVNAYLERLYRVAEHDPGVALAFMKVAHLVAPPPTIFAPAVFARVMMGPRVARAPSPSVGHA